MPGHPVIPPEIPARAAAHVKKHILVEQHGTAEKQKESLVDFILNSFETPATWPLTPDQQAKFMREAYQRALNVRRTEGKR